MRPIHVVALQGDLDIAKALLNAGADVNSPGDVRMIEYKRT